MRQHALHAAAGATASEHSHHGPSDAVGDRRPSDYGLPAAPPPDRGLAPTREATVTLPDGPLEAVRSQRFDSLPLDHEVSLDRTDTGVELTATLTNAGEEPWAYRAPRGPAPLTGGRFDCPDGDLRVVSADGDDLFSDGVLHPGETVKSTLSVSAFGGTDGRWPRGEHTLIQPLRLWQDEATYGYNWEVTLSV